MHQQWAATEAGALRPLAGSAELARRTFTVDACGRVAT
jgi:hypothetical protein